MGNVDVDVVGARPHSARRCSADGTSRVANDRPRVRSSGSLHSLNGLRDAGAQIRHPARRGPARPTVAPQLEAQEASIVDSFDHDRSGAVAEQDARPTIGPVGHLGESLGADDERAPRQAGRDRAVGLGKRVDEACAACREVKGGSVQRADLFAYE